MSAWSSVPFVSGGRLKQRETEADREMNVEREDDGMRREEQMKGTQRLRKGRREEQQKVRGYRRRK